MDLRYLEIDEEALMAYVESQKVLELTPEMVYQELPHFLETDEEDLADYVESQKVVAPWYTRVAYEVRHGCGVAIGVDGIHKADYGVAHRRSILVYGACANEVSVSVCCALSDPFPNSLP